MSRLAQIMAGVSAELRASMEASRSALEHRGEKGSAIEGAVRDFFRKHLPTSVGVAHGEVVDRCGNTSTQLDVILYDQLRTPVLFSDKEAGVRVIPAEGVIAAIEVKTSLQLADIPKLVEASARLTGLERFSYYREENPVIREVAFAYGREFEVLPPFYFILAFEGPDLTNLAKNLAMNSNDRELPEQIDSICVLNRGVVTNATLNEFHKVETIDALPSPETFRFPIETKHSLLLFYLLTSRYILQTQKPPINIQKYLPKEFNFLD